MPTTEPLVERLRSLRKRTRALHETMADDLRPFLHEEDRRSFRRLPVSLSKKGDVTVASTCTGIMCAAMDEQARSVYRVEGNTDQPLIDSEDATTALGQAFAIATSAEWTSSLLPFENAFTRTLILRTAGILATRNSQPVPNLLGSIHMERKVAS